MSTYNLDIETYSLKELLALFKINSIDDLNETTLAAAKKKMLFMHPDKSGLPSDYFIFFTKAYNLLLIQYNTNSKTTAVIDPNKEILYKDYEIKNTNIKEIARAADELDKDKYNEMFNTAFEKLQTNKINKDDYNWFTEDTRPTELVKDGNSFNINKYNEIKKKESNQIQKYNGVQKIYSSGSFSNNKFFKEDNNSVEYASSDIFSKLKYEDIRKVYKDQTLLQVSEMDTELLPTSYSNVDELKEARSNMKFEYKPESVLDEKIREDHLKYGYGNKLHNSVLDSMKNEKKIQDTFSTFLRLT